MGACDGDGRGSRRRSAGGSSSLLLLSALVVFEGRNDRRERVAFARAAAKRIIIRDGRRAVIAPLAKKCVLQNIDAFCARYYWVALRSWASWTSLAIRFARKDISSDSAWKWLFDSLLPSLSFDDTENSSVAIRISSPYECGRDAMGPIIRWNDRIMGILNRQVYLVTSSAWISTLGGGHYLCRQIEEARMMARRQHSVAMQMGDLVLAAQCRIHLIYLAIQCGELEKADHLVKAERQKALDVLDGDKGVLQMLSSAELYIFRLRQAAKKCESDDPNFQRQRFVKLKADLDFVAQ